MDLSPLDSENILIKYLTLIYKKANFAEQHIKSIKTTFLYKCCKALK